MPSFFDLISRLQISIDALDVILFGDDDAVASVDGKTKSSIAKSIKEQLANLNALVEGRKAYTTLSSLVNDAGADTTKLAEVWKDTAENNGVYGYDNGAWEKTDFDVFDELVKDLTPNLFLDTSFSGLYSKSILPSNLLDNASYNPTKNTHELTIPYVDNTYSFVDYHIDIESIVGECKVTADLFCTATNAVQICIIYYDDANSEIARHRYNSKDTGEQSATFTSQKPANATSSVLRIIRYAGVDIVQSQIDFVIGNVKVFSQTPTYNLLNEELVYLKNSVSQLLRQPSTQRVQATDLVNYIKDPHNFTGLKVSTTNAKVNVISEATGRHAVLQSSENVQITVPASLFSGFLSAGVTMSQKQIGQSGARVLLLQYDESGAEIARNSSTVASATEVLIHDSNSYQFIEFSNVEVLDTAYKIVLYLDAGLGQPVMFTNPWIVDGFANNIQSIPARQYLDFWVDPEFNMLTATNKAGVASIDGFGDTVLTMNSVDVTDVLRYEIDASYLPSAFYLCASMKSNELTAEVGVLFLDINRQELSRKIYKNTQVNSWQKIDALIDVPSQTAIVQIRFVNWTDGTSAIAQFKHITITEQQVGCIYRSAYKEQPISAALDTIYLSQEVGDDENSGAKDSPILTSTEAVSRLKNGGRVIIMDDEYINLSFNVANVIGNFEVSSLVNKKVRIIYDRDILKSVWVSTAYANVYSQECETAPNKFVWHHDRPQGEILQAERHPLHGGRTHRLSSSKLVAANSLENCSATPGSWFYIGGSLYIHPIDSDDPNLYSYFLPTANSLFSGNHTSVNLEARGVNVLYGRFNVTGCNSYMLYQCSSLGSSSNSMDRGKTRGIEYRCEFAGSENDGGNGHNINSVYDGAGLPFASSVVLFDQWSHDCYDDGDSLHERCEGTYHGGLFEYNGDRGIATSYGAHVTLYGAVAQYNGQNARGSSTAGEGFSIVGDLSSDELGVGTQMICFGCTSIGNNLNYAVNTVSTDVNAKLEAINSHSESALVAAYSAQTGQVILRNCTDIGSPTIKRELDGGQVIVKNGTLVV